MLKENLSVNQLNQLILLTSFTESKLNELYENDNLKIFDTDYDLFNWLNEGEWTWESYLWSIPIKEMLNNLSVYTNKEELSTYDAMIKDRISMCDRIYQIDDKFVYIF